MRAPVRAKIALQYAALDPALGALVHGSLPRLLATLQHTNIRPLRESDGMVRGRIDWPSTLRRQASRGPASFVVRVRQADRDLPENQLLRWLCAALERALSPTPDDIVDGHCAGDGAEPVPNRVQSLRHALRRLAGDPRLAGVSTPEALEPEHMQRALDSSIPEYHELARGAVRFQALAERHAPDTLFEVGGRLRILPGRASAATLPWSRVAALLEARRT